MEYGAVKPSAYPNWQAVEKEVLGATAKRRVEDPKAEIRVTERMPDILEAYGFARLLAAGVNQANEAFMECARRRNVSLAEVTQPLAPLLAKVKEMANEGGPLYHLYKNPADQRILSSLVSSNGNLEPK